MAHGEVLVDAVSEASSCSTTHEDFLLVSGDSDKTTAYVWRELTAAEVELEPPTLHCKEPVAAGTQLSGKAYLDVFDDAIMRGADLCVFVEMEGDSWCRTQSQTQSRSPSPQAISAVLERSMSATSFRDRLFQRRTSVTFSDDDYPKTFHFLKRIPVWPKKDRRPTMDTGDDELLESVMKTLNIQFPSPRHEKCLSSSDDVTGEHQHASNRTSTSTFNRRENASYVEAPYTSGDNLGVGHHVWTFQCLLPEALCTSVELPCASGIGGVRYRLRTTMSLIRDGRELLHTSEWARFQVRQEVDAAPQYNKGGQEQAFSGTENQLFQLPWMNYQLRARMEHQGYARGDVFNVHFSLRRSHARLKSMAVQADLLQRITLNLGGKSCGQEKAQAKLVRGGGQAGGLLRQFHCLHSDMVVCGSEVDYTDKLLIYIPPRVIPTFCLSRVSVEYFVEVKVPNNAKRTIILPIHIGTENSAHVKVASPLPANGSAGDEAQITGSTT